MVGRGGHWKAVSHRSGGSNRRVGRDFARGARGPNRHRTASPQNAQGQIGDHGRHVDRSPSTRTGRCAAPSIIAEDVTAQERAEVERNFLLAREREARSRPEEWPAAGFLAIATGARRRRCWTRSLRKRCAVVGDILTQGMEALGATAASISRTVPGKAKLEIVAAAGYGDEALWGFRRIPLGCSCPPRLFPPAPVRQCGSSRPINGTLGSPTSASARGDIPPRSSASIPLLVKGSVLGTIGLSFSTLQSFSDDDKGFAISLAQQCAQALERARLYEAERAARDEAESSRRRFEFLAQASITLSSSLGWLDDPGQRRASRRSHTLQTRIGLRSSCRGVGPSAIARGGPRWIGKRSHWRTNWVGGIHSIPMRPRVWLRCCGRPSPELIPLYSRRDVGRSHPGPGPVAHNA